MRRIKVVQKRDKITLIISILIIVLLLIGGWYWLRKDNLGKNTLAIVNGSKITKEDFNEEFKFLPEQYQTVFKNDKIGFLDELIVQELLLQKAKEFNLDSELNEQNNEEQKSVYINKIIAEITKDVKVSEQEKEEFYSNNTNKMQGREYEEVKQSIENYLLQQKQTEVIKDYINTLKNKAEIVKNQDWLKEQQTAQAKNPLNEALENGKPTVLDMGSSSCIPCKEMQPILEELKEEYKDRADIIVLDVYEYRDLASKYQVRAIPTQIFFNSKGEEVWRHQGFLPKEDIIKKLEEMGVK